MCKAHSAGALQQHMQTHGLQPVPRSCRPWCSVSCVALAADDAPSPESNPEALTTAQPP